MTNKPLDLAQFEGHSGESAEDVADLLAECRRLQASEAHWKDAHQNAIAGGDILKETCGRQREEIAFIERFADAPDVKTGKTTRDEQREQIAKLREALERIKSIVQHEPLGKLGNALTEIARAALKATA